jgi:hypothetical protein
MVETSSVGGEVSTTAALGQTAGIVVNHRPLGSVLLWSRLMGEHFAGTRHAQHFLSHEGAEALHAATETR